MTDQKFHLRRMTEKDLKQVFEWRNSDHIRLNMFNNSLILWDEHLRWFERINGAQNHSYQIFEIARRPVGLVCFSDMDKKNKSCFWGFYIGEPDCPKGSGFVMGFLGLEHAFNDLAMHKVYGECFTFNNASIKFHEGLGFRREGLFVEHQYRDGKYQDIIRYGLLSREWATLRPQMKMKAFGSSGE